MKNSSILQAVCLVAPFLMAPANEPSGGVPGIVPENPEGNEQATQNPAQSMEEMTKEAVELEARANELGIPIPSFPGTPEGIHACREELKRLIADKEAEGSGGGEGGAEEDAPEEDEEQPVE